ncbi:MAG: hypothetical protein HDS72_08470 [Bacteroidales bacterium]|nr:hypothetical protein [Bacteroidales bacterium]
MKKAFYLLAVLISLGAMAQNTTRRNLQPAPAQAATQSSQAAGPTYDTIAAPRAHLLDINGYDKPLRSRRETFFVTNNTTAPVASIAFTINYLDTSGRQLHSASQRVGVDIPAGETRQVSLRSWDEQQAFYYTRSAVPTRAAQATPYDVTITVDTIFTR